MMEDWNDGKMGQRRFAASEKGRPDPINPD